MNNCNKPIEHQCGVTLLELLSTLVILAVLSSIAISGWSAIKENYNLMADKNRLLTLINAARQIAITNNTYATVCHLKNNKCSAFASPFTVFTDNNNNQALDLNETIISVTTTSTAAKTQWNRNKRIRFAPNGHAGGYNGTLNYCANGKGFNVIISTTGRIRTKNNQLCH
jgi:type IV fimbrial biogenesis protein FimT